MAARKPTLRPAPPRPDLERLFEEARAHGVTEEQLQEQRVSFAYGNASLRDDSVTKESVRAASARRRLVPA